LIIADFSLPQLRQRLAGPGLNLRTGPVVTRIHTTLKAVVEGLALHYAEHPVEDYRAFADFDVRVRQPRGLRRWYRPQVYFEIDGASPFKPLAAMQAFAMTEWGLNWCVSSHCHQYLTIHAAVVERGGRALVLPAPPGSGKSTLCAGLVSRGWRLLSDELTLIDPDSGRLVPIPRPVSLKNASIEVIRRFSQEAVLGPVVRETTKGDVAHMRPPADSVRRAAETAAPGWVVLPRYVPGAEANLTRLSKARAMMQLADNSFNYSLHGRRGFEVLAGVIDASDCYEFTYSRLHDADAVFRRLSEAGATRQY
jgi:HprK-related kinase A